MRIGDAKHWSNLEVLIKRWNLKELKIARVEDFATIEKKMRNTEAVS
jgi:hypothetical protein